MESQSMSLPDFNDSSPAAEASGFVKRRRITRACDRCHRSGIKCSAGPTLQACGPCTSYGSRCTYNRPSKRRGPPPKHTDHVDTMPHPAVIPLSGTPLFKSGAEWSYREVAPHHIISDLVAFYSTVIYPILVDHHLPTLFSRIHSRQYMHSRAVFADIMALCALSSARIRDGASCPNHPVTPEMIAVPSEVYYEAVLNALPAELSDTTDFEYKRARLTLAFLSIQYGDTRGMQRHLGDYCTMSAMDGFHLESRWPAGLSEVEIQERRRLLDIYTSCTWGATARHREAETTVLYPAEVFCDDDITPTSIQLGSGSGSGQAVSFWQGWNFVTDLYRILEHAMEKVRMRQIGKDVMGDAGGGASGTGQGGPVSALFQLASGPSQADIMHLVNKLYEDLPEAIRIAKPMGPDEASNRLGFQATNIIITLQTLRMVVAGTGESSVSQRCEIAGNLLDAISNVPTAYIYASSAPVLHHLAGVGHLLGSVASRPQTLSPWQYLQVRNCLLSMADMLAGLEAVLSRAAGIADRLRTHIERIDRYMAQAAKERAGRGLVHGVVKVVTEEDGPGQVGTGSRDVKGTSGNPHSAHPSGQQQPSEEERAIIQALSYIDNDTLGLAQGDGPSSVRRPTDTNTSLEGGSSSLDPSLSLFDLGASRVDQNANSYPVNHPSLLPPSISLAIANNGNASGDLDSWQSVVRAEPDPPPAPASLRLPDDLFADWSSILGDAFAFLGDNEDLVGQHA